MLARHLSAEYPYGSSDYHGHDNSRSFIGIHPIARIAVAHGVITTLYPDGTESRQNIDASVKGRAKEQVADAINDFLRHFSVEGRLGIFRCVWFYGI